MPTFDTLAAFWTTPMIKTNVLVFFNLLGALLLGLLVLCDVFATLADAVSLGGPLGIRMRSYWASWLASIRAVILTPFEAILTLAFILLVWYALLCAVAFEHLDQRPAELHLPLRRVCLAVAHFEV